VRVSTELAEDGVTLVRTIDDNGDGTATVTVWTVDPPTVTVVELAAPVVQPLDPTGSLAALLACLEVVPIVDAANAVRVTAAALEAEVLAWEAAAEG
jgi:hypothetical protein